MSKTNKPTTPAERQAKRRAALNLAADLMGFDSWTKFETAVIRGEIVLQAIPVDEVERMSETLPTDELSEWSQMISDAAVHYMGSDEDRNGPIVEVGKVESDEKGGSDDHCD